MDTAKYQHDTESNLEVVVHAECPQAVAAVFLGKESAADNHHLSAAQVHVAVANVYQSQNTTLINDGGWTDGDRKGID